MLSASNHISTQFKNDNAEFRDSKLRSAVFGGERKYNAILRANTIKRHFIEDSNSWKDEDVEDELKSRNSGSFIHDNFYNNSPVSVSVYFEDISTDGRPLNKNVLFQHNSESETESSKKGLSDHDDRHTKENKIYKQQQNPNDNYPEVNWNTHATTFITNENSQVWKNICFKDIMDNIDPNTPNEKKKNSKILIDSTSGKQVTKSESKYSIKSVDNVLMKVLKSMLLENLQDYTMIEEIFKSIVMNDFVISKYIKYCSHQNLYGNDPQLQNLIKVYSEIHKDAMRPEILELQCSEFFEISKKNVKSWFFKNHQLILKAAGEPDWIKLNLDLNMVTKKHKLKAGNKLKKDFLNLMESFLQNWWQLEIKNSKEKLRKGLAKRVKNIRIVLIPDRKLENDPNPHMSDMTSENKINGKSFRQIFSISDKKVSIHGILIEFLDLKRYMFEDISESQIIIIGKN